MKNSSFENNLKSLSQDFVVDINQQQFSRVMELRAKQHKREMLLWWFVSVTATILFSLFLTLTTKLNQTATNNTHLSVHKNNKVIEIVKESNLSNTTSTQIKINTPKHDLKTSLSNDLKSSANLKHQKNSALNPNILTHQTTKNIKLNVIEPHQTINEEVTYTFINKPELIKHQDYSIAIATIKNVVLPLNNNLTEIEKHKIGSKLIKGIYFKAAYFPFLSAKNTSSMLPNKKASLVGLGEDANFAQSLSAGIVINLTPNLEITGGIGIQTIRFDKIRTIDINVRLCLSLWLHSLLQQVLSM
jgi:hypothetical protein